MGLELSAEQVLLLCLVFTQVYIPAYKFLYSCLQIFLHLPLTISSFAPNASFHIAFSALLQFNLIILPPLLGFSSPNSYRGTDFSRTLNHCLLHFLPNLLEITDLIPSIQESQHAPFFYRCFLNFSQSLNFSSLLHVLPYSCPCPPSTNQLNFTYYKRMI